MNVTMWPLMSELLPPHESRLRADNQSTQAGGGLCSPLFDLVHIMFLVRLVAGQVLCLSRRLQAACYCFLTDKVWEPTKCASVETSWPADNEVIQYWLDTKPCCLFFHMKHIWGGFVDLCATGISWQVCDISLPVTSSFVLVFHYCVAE